MAVRVFSPPFSFQNSLAYGLSDAGGDLKAILSTHRLVEDENDAAFLYQLAGGEASFIPIRAVRGLCMTFSREIGPNIM
jgi:hypothetical protein